jgi:hypothetical protein
MTVALSGLRCPKHEHDVMVLILDSWCYHALFVDDPHQLICVGRHVGRWRRLGRRTSQAIEGGVRLNVRF